MVAEPDNERSSFGYRCSLAKISMVAEQKHTIFHTLICCSLAKISMVAEQIQLKN